MILHNLPQQVMPFVGRETDLTDINILLNDPNCRLLSLVGAGGMGKTRLSLEVAQRNLHKFEDGVYFVPLQAFRSPEDIKMAIALAIRFQFGREKDSLDQLLDYLNGKHMLLVLDNFEHLLDGSDMVGKILERASHVKILVTSREALKLRSEWIRIVMGMDFPLDGSVVIAKSYGALQLFMERARRFQPHFSLEDNLDCAIHICQFVGGMPLGIELAVAWLKTLTCSEIVEELQGDVDILTAQMRDIPEKHQSIRMVFDSTWAMLTADEQTAFMKLSVFRGTPTRQAIQVVTGATLQTLSGLADKALVVPSEDGRYQIHELLRQYAYEKLEASNDYLATFDAHSQYYLRFLQEREPDLQGGRQIEALDEITLDFENVRAAWLWGAEHKDYDGISGAVEPLCLYLHQRSRWQQDSHILTQAQRYFAPQRDDPPHRVWGQIISRNAFNDDDTMGQLELALEIAKAHEDQSEIGLSIHLRGYIYLARFDYEKAISCHEASILYFESVKNQHLLASAYRAAAKSYRLIGQYERAATYNRISLNVLQELGDLDGQIWVNSELSHERFIVGDFDGAERYRRDALAQAQQLGGTMTVLMQTWELVLIHQFGIKGDLGRDAKLIMILCGSIRISCCTILRLYRCGSSCCWEMHLQPYWRLMMINTLNERRNCWLWR